MKVETTGRTVILCSLHSLSSAAEYWSAGVLTLDITTDIYVVFDVTTDKIKSVLSIEHTGLHPTVKVPPIAMSNEKTTRTYHLIYYFLCYGS